jgi:hypothetical protein
MVLRPGLDGVETGCIEMLRRAVSTAPETGVETG